MAPQFFDVSEARADLRINSLKEGERRVLTLQIWTHPRRSRETTIHRGLEICGRNRGILCGPSPNPFWTFKGNMFWGVIFEESLVVTSCLRCWHPPRTSSSLSADIVDTLTADLYSFISPFSSAAKIVPMRQSTLATHTRLGS